MKMYDLSLAIRRILCISLALLPLLAATAARAQLPPQPYGERQSPVDVILSQVVPDTDPPQFSDTAQLGNPITLKLKNSTGTRLCDTCTGLLDQRWGSLKAYPPDPPKPPDAAPVIVFGKERYTLQEFHFHTPAEHLIDGQLAEMEIHFVFRKNGPYTCAAGEYLVVGQRIVEGKVNDELDKIFRRDDLPTQPDRYVVIQGFRITQVFKDMVHPFPATASYRYAGSLTAPAALIGCRNPPVGPGNPNAQLETGYLPEVVSWVLLDENLTMSPNQIARYQKLFPNGDARGPQALNQKVKKAAGSE